MEIQDKFGHVSKFSCKYPRGFLVSAFVTHPSDQVQQFTGVTSVINLGIKNFGDFKLGFIIYHDSRWGGAELNQGSGMGGWVPTWKHGTLGVWLRGCQGVVG